MFLTISFALLSLNGLAQAIIDFENWAPPGPGDVRGPCPAMNSMANHHIIPHNGKNLTVSLVAEALAGTFNLSPEMGTIVAGIGLNTAPDPSLGYFQLDHLNKHNAFEHDASLSRVDFAFSGEEGVAKFDNETFHRWFSHFDGLEYIDMEIAAKARYAQVQYSRKHTPGFTYEQQHRITSYAETIKYMKTMVDSTNQTKREFVKILFGEYPLILLQEKNTKYQRVNRAGKTSISRRMAHPERASHGVPHGRLRAAGSLGDAREDALVWRDSD